MFNYFRSLIVSKTAFDSAILLSGAVVSTVIGFFITIILARNLSQDNLGIVLTALTFTQLLVDLSEIGIGSTLLNFIPSDYQNRDKFLKTTFLLKLFIGISVSVGVLTAANLIDSLLFKNNAIIPFLRLSAAGFFFLIFITWFQSVFQAEKKFIWATLSSGLINILRIAGLLVILILGLFNIFNAYLLMQLVLLLAVIILALKLGLHFLKAPISIKDFKKMLSFGLPIGVGFSLAALYTRLDQIFIFQLGGPREAGIYGLSFRVASVLIFASSALGSAIIPRFSALAKDKFRSYFNKTLIVTAALAVLSICGLVIAPPILLILFGEKFKDSILPFQILGVGMVFFMLTAPFSNAIVFFLKKPVFSFWNALTSLCIIAILLYFLIPRYGSVGAAVAVAGLYFLQLVWTVVFFNFQYSQQKDV